VKPRKPACAPRKRPRQGRSKTTVEAIVEATARILSKEGYAAATTRRVADVAGVGIGSLYQYFPSRDALIAAVLERPLDRIAQATGAVFERHKDAPPAVTLRAFAGMLIEAHAVDPGLQKVLAEHAPRLQELGLLRTLEQRMGEHITAYWNGRGPTLPFDMERALFVLNKCCAELIRAAALEHPDWLRDGRLTEDLYRLIVGYLALPTAPGAT